MLPDHRIADTAKPSDREYEINDLNLKGFGLRVMPSGAKSWFIVYRNGDGGTVSASRIAAPSRSSSMSVRNRPGQRGAIEHDCFTIHDNDLGLEPIRAADRLEVLPYV